MKIVTWNCNLNFAKKYQHIESMDADICIIQECEKLKEDYFPNKRFIKIRFSDFLQTTHEQAISSSREKWVDLSIFRQLLHQGLKRRDKPVRLLGAGFGLLPNLACEEDQLTLFSRQE